MKKFTLSHAQMGASFLLLLTLFLLPGSLLAQKTWVGTLNTNWNDGGNWSPSGVPGASDVVIIDNGGVVTLDYLSTTIKQLNLVKGTLGIGKKGDLLVDLDTVGIGIAIGDTGNLLINGVVTVTNADVGVSIRNSNNGSLIVANRLVLDMDMKGIEIIMSNSTFQVLDGGTVEVKGTTDIAFDLSSIGPESFDNQGLIELKGIGGTGFSIDDAAVRNDGVIESNAASSGVGFAILSAGQGSSAFTNGECGIIRILGSTFSIQNNDAFINQGIIFTNSCNNFANNAIFNGGGARIFADTSTCFAPFVNGPGDFIADTTTTPTESLCVPVPTMSEWALVVLALSLLSLATLFIGQQQLAFSGVSGFSIKGRLMPFSQELFGKILLGCFLVAGLGLAIGYGFSGEVTNTDIIGSFLSAAILAYLIHLVSLFARK